MTRYDTLPVFRRCPADSIRSNPTFKFFIFFFASLAFFAVVPSSSRRKASQGYASQSLVYRSILKRAGDLQ